MSEVRRGKPYIVVLLKRGPNYDTTQGVHMDHLAHIFRQRADGEQLVTLPVMQNNKDIVGISVYASTNVEHVTHLVGADPGVAAGRFTFEILGVMGMPGDTLS